MKLLTNKFLGNSLFKPGITLIELTVIITIILSLISVLFIGANAYRNVSSKTTCIIQLRNIQLSVRAEQNSRGLEPGSLILDRFLIADNILYGNSDSYFLMEPTCPRDKAAYSYNDLDKSFPEIGKQAAFCQNFNQGTAQHNPTVEDLLTW